MEGYEPYIVIIGAILLTVLISLLYKWISKKAQGYTPSPLLNEVKGECKAKCNPQVFCSNFCMTTDPRFPSPGCRV